MLENSALSPASEDMVKFEGLKVFERVTQRPISLPSKVLSGGLLLLDLFVLLIAFFMFFKVRTPGNTFFNPNAFHLLWVTPVILFSLYVFELYHLDGLKKIYRIPGRALGAILTSGTVVAVLNFLTTESTRGGVLGRFILISSLVVFFLYLMASRLVVGRWVRSIAQKVRWLVIGDRQWVPHLWADALRADSDEQFFFLTRDQEDRSFISNLPILGTWAEVDNWIHKPWAGIIVDGITGAPEGLVNKLMRARLKNQPIYNLSDFYEAVWLKIPVFSIKDSWFAMAHGFQLLHNPIGLRVKRAFDVIAAFVLLVLSAPVLMVSALLIKLEDGGPIFYRQIRTGEGGSEFNILKLRSMNINAESGGARWASTADSRVTRIGRFIRRTRIDELPQMYNVIKGEMSLIGPRPERPVFNAQLEKEIPYYNLRHLVRPGITGWAQIMYPYGNSVEDAREKLQYDLYYIKNYSLLLDFIIFLKTVRVVLSRKGL